MKISVIIPVYNMGSCIEACVASICSQKEADFEVILVDDGSKDDSFAKCSQLARQDERIRAFHTENQGSGPARNYGIAQAQGDYALFIDADDQLEPGALARLVQSTQNGYFDLIVFGFYTKSFDGKQIHVKSFPHMTREGQQLREDYSDYVSTKSRYSIQGAPWNKLFSLRVIREHHLAYPALRRHQDEGFISRYMCHAAHVAFIEDVLYTHFNNSLRQQWDKFPVNYLDAVIGLQEERKTNLLVWNPQDTATHNMVYKEYIDNVVKALELSFSPKFHFKRRERLAWLQDSVARSGLLQVPRPLHLMGRYKKIVLRLLDGGHIRLIHLIFHLKITLEKKSILNPAK